MEDSAEAIIYAFSVFVFLLALSVSFTMFNQAKTVFDMIATKTDTTYLAEYTSPLKNEDGSNYTGGRIVGVETVIPTLYRYYKENFSVEIVGNGTIEELFDLDKETRYRNRVNDEDESTVYKVFNGRNITYGYLYPQKIQWLGSATNTDVKLRVDSYITGEKIQINHATQYVDHNTDLNGASNLRNGFDGIIFRETFEEIDDSEKLTSEIDGSSVLLTSGTKKTVITYTRRSS